MAKRAPKLPIYARNRPSKGSKGKHKMAFNDRKERPRASDAGSVRSAGQPGMFPKGR